MIIASLTSSIKQRNVWIFKVLSYAEIHERISVIVILRGTSYITADAVHLTRKLKPCRTLNNVIYQCTQKCNYWKPIDLNPHFGPVFSLCPNKLTGFLLWNILRLWLYLSSDHFSFIIHHWFIFNHDVRNGEISTRWNFFFLMLMWTYKNTSETKSSTNDA